MRIAVFTMFLVVSLAGGAAQTNSAENAAIKKPAIDYIEGWYAGNAEGMESALHPELAKRMFYVDPRTNKSVFTTMGAKALVDRTRAGGDKTTRKNRQRQDITILDRFNRLRRSRKIRRLDSAQR